MKRIVLVLCTFFVLFSNNQNVNGQCSTTSCVLPNPSLSAPDACIMCTLAALENFSYSTSPTMNTITWPTAFCGTVENNHWYAFAAPQASVTFNFTVSNCLTPAMGGIQAEVYCSTDCSNNMTSVSNCWTPGMEANGTVTATGLIPGDIYYLMVDGFAGDVCDYTINITDPPGGGGFGQLPPPTGITGNFEVCYPSLGFEPYELPTGNSCGSSLLWTIQPPNMGTIVSDPTQTNILVQWNSPGTAQLCIQANNPCSVSQPGCETVTITQVPPTTEMADICLPGTTICAGQVFDTPGFFPVILQTAAGCDSIVNCIINALPIIPVTNAEAEYCAPAVHEVCGNFYSVSGIHTTVCTASNGCDSTVITDLVIMETEAVVAPPDEIGCDPSNQQVTLDASASTFSLGLGVIVEYSWDGPSFCGPTDDVFACVDEPGTYCFTVSLERNGVICDDVMCVDVEANNDVPPTPDLTGSDEVCDPSMETYTALSVGTPLPDGYTWTTPNGEPFTDNGNSIIVDWTGSTGGNLCVTADNECGPSDPPACISVVISTGPENPTVSGDNMVCDGDSETYSIDNPDTSATYIWTVPTGASFTNNGTSITVDFGGAMNGDICVEGTNDCGTSDEFCLSVTLINVPDEPVFSSGADLLCDGVTEIYCVTAVSGATSYTWDTPAGNFPGESECIQIDWTGSGGGEVCVTADNDCGSSQQTCINVTVDEGPTAEISGGGSFCENSGDSIDLNIEFTGTGPWTFTYNDGTNPDITETTSDNPFVLTVNIAGNYVLTSVDDETDCSGTVSGEAIVTENSEPTASLSGSGAICAGSGSTVDLIIDLTGEPNWTVDWTLDGTPQAALNISNSPYTLSISENQAGNIELTGVTDGNDCSGTVSGNVTVTVNDAPEVSGISTNCDGTNTNYTVEFTISGGDENTYSITPNTGTLNGNVFTSDPISSGDGYHFIVTDVNDCSPVTVEQNAVICDCGTDVGDMDDEPLEECGDGPTTATYNSMGESLDADDILVYILHEGSGLNIINPLDTNATDAIFAFLSGSMTYGVTYYISAVVGNNDGNGSVDLSDPCLAVAQGTPVIFNEIPTGILSGTIAICEGEDADLSIDFTGPGPWSIVYSDETGQHPVTGITANPFTLNITPSATSTVTLDFVSNADCNGTADGSAEITVNSAVEISGLTTTCNQTATGYTVTFQISGGDPDSYEILPIGSGTIDPNGLFTSNEITAPTGYSFIINDANNCAPQIVTDDEVTCDCATSVGAMNTNSIDECGEGPISAFYDNSNENLDADDVLIFILHEGNGSNIINEIARNDVADFGFLSGSMIYGTTYYISAVVGNNDGNGSADLSDPCVAISVGTPVTFYEIPMATLSGTQSICAGECTNLVINFTGDAPYSILLNDGNSDINISGINSNPFNYQVCPTATTNYTFTQFNDENCIGSGAGIATVTVNEAPTIINDNLTINASNTGYTLSFEITGGDPDSYVISPNNGTLNGNIFTSNEFPCGSPYSFSVDDGSGCGPIILSSPPITCDCVSEAGNMDTEPLIVCGTGPIEATYLDGETLDGNDALCFIIHNGDEVPISINDEPIFSFNQFSMNYGNTYYICAAAGDDNGNGCVDFGDDCLSIGTCTEVIFNEIPTATILGGDNICAGEQVEITVDFTGNGPWEFTYSANQGNPVTVSDISENPYTFFVNPNVSTTYQLSQVSDINCPGTTSGIVIANVANAPFITPATESCNSTNTAYTVSFQINGGDPFSYSVTPPNGTIDANGVFTSDEIPSGSGYQFFVDDGNGCGPIEVSNNFFECECETWSGTIFPLSSINECGEGPVLIEHDGNEILDGNDVLNFFIHSGNNVPLMVSTDGNFTFDDVILDYDVVYQVCAVAGNDIGNGLVDFGDPCRSISSCRTISFHEIPTATLSGDQNICENENTLMTVDFTGTGPFSITYESSIGGQITEGGITSNPYTVSIPVTQSDVFSLVNVSSLWCDGIAGGTANIQVTNAPDFDLASLMYDCDPVNFEYTVSVEITGGDPATYVMSGMPGTLNGNVFTSDPISGLTPFQFMVNDQFGCGPNELANVSPIPTGTISGENTICLGDQTKVIFHLSGESPYHIEYIDENGITQYIDSDQPTAEIDVEPTQTSAVTLVSVTNPNTGCGHSPNESVTITVNTQPNAGIANEPFRICQGVPNVTNLDNLLSNADSGGQWFNSVGNIIGSDFNTESQTAGIYEFIYTVPGLPPCDNDSETVTVIIDELPPVEAGDGGELTCDNTTVSIGGAHVSGLSYSWSLAGGPFPGDSTQATADVNLPGDYILTVTNDETGCLNSDMVTVIQNAEQPSADILTSDVRCFGENNGLIAIQNVSGGAGPYVYSFNGSPFTEQTTYDDLGPGEYEIIVEDTKGCSQTLNFEIAEPEELDVTISGDFNNNENLIDLGDSLLLKLEVSVPFGALDVVSWYPPELIQCDTCETTWTYPTLQTNFSVNIEKDGCSAEDEITVFVRKNRPVYVPNAFAPGGDGHAENDRFRIYGGHQVERVKSFRVFNRWGEIVFEAKDFDPRDSGNLNIGWDGTFRGEPMDAGVFVWFAEIEFINGEVEIYEGDVILVR